MLAQRVTVVTCKGENIPGVIGSKPPHILTPEERKKPLEMKDMSIDIGASSKEEAEKFGVCPGDSIVPYCDFTVMRNEKMLMAKSFDNRIGCAIAIEVMRCLHKIKHPNTVYCVGTVQEEVGLRGAQTAAHSIQPDIGFAVDTGIPGDTPGVTEKEALSRLGEGPQILLYDTSMISHKDLREFVLDVANSEGIPYQLDFILGGGTDAGKIHLTAHGVPTLAITIATRYIHTNASIIHREDFENAVKLMVEIIRRLDSNKVKEITFT
jgi:putative aminopeptidase FrvX